MKSSSTTSSVTNVASTNSFANSGSFSESSSDGTSLSTLASIELTTDAKSRFFDSWDANDVRFPGSAPSLIRKSRLHNLTDEEVRDFKADMDIFQWSGRFERAENMIRYVPSGQGSDLSKEEIKRRQVEEEKKTLMREAVKLLRQQKDVGKGGVSEESEDSEDHSDDSDEDSSETDDKKLDKVKLLTPKKKDQTAGPSSLQKRTVRRLPKRGYVSMPNM